MNKEAYEAGVEQALVDVGLLGVTKQAGDKASFLLEKLKALLSSSKELGASGLRGIRDLGAGGLEGFSGLGPVAQGMVGGGLGGGIAGAGGTALGGGDISDILLGAGAGAGLGAGAGGAGGYVGSRLGKMLAKQRLLRSSARSAPGGGGIGTGADPRWKGGRLTDKGLDFRSGFDPSLDDLLEALRY